MKAEGRMTIRTEEVPVTLADGTVVTLSRPYYGIADLAYGSLHPDVMLSPRVAPQMIGLGLLEAVYDSDIERLADPEDADGDGISGRVNRVWDDARQAVRSEEHTSELQSLMRISYAVFCLTKKKHDS